MSKSSKQQRKKLNSKKVFYSDLENRAYFLRKQMGEGLTLEQVAVLRGVPLSELLSEISEHPRMIQAMKDGKSDGMAYWQTKLTKAMYDNSVNSALFKVFLGNYMDWWSAPMPEDIDDNITVVVNVYERKPTKKEKAGMDKAKAMAI